MWAGWRAAWRIALALDVATLLGVVLLMPTGGARWAVGLVGFTARVALLATLAPRSTFDRAG
jgi:hypothetical protein